jgi:twitching motility two-component system response regulator PilH
VLLPETQKSDAAAVSDRIKSLFEALLVEENLKEQVLFSCPLAGSPEDGSALESLLRRIAVTSGVVSGKVLLLIEDEPDQAQLVQSRLRSQGLQVIWASDGEEGFEKACEELPNLILMDVVIPKMNGFETCKKIKNDPRVKEIPIVLVSAFEMDDFSGQCRAVGADAWLKRPYDPADLTTTVEKFIKNGNDKA